VECATNSIVSIDRFTPSTGAVVTSSAPVAPPILDRNEDGVVNPPDVVLNPALLAVNSVDGANGTITLRCTSDHGDGILGGNDGSHFTLTYRHPFSTPTPTPVPFLGTWALVLVGLLFSALAFWRIVHLPRH
jgi:hypothetical protein